MVGIPHSRRTAWQKFTFQCIQPDILKNMMRAKAAGMSTVWPTTECGGFIPHQLPQLYPAESKCQLCHNSQVQKPV